MNFDNLEMARGIVHFLVWPMAREDGQHDLYIEGETYWARSVVGLSDAEPVLLDDNGEMCLLSVYLDRVMPRELQSDHSFHKHVLHREGPVGCAPRIVVRPN